MPKYHCCGASITRSIPDQGTTYAQTLASLPVQDGGFLRLGYEYFHLELGAVSSILINKRRVSEHQGVKQSPQKQQRMISFPNAKPKHVIKGRLASIIAP